MTKCLRIGRVFGLLLCALLTAWTDSRAQSQETGEVLAIAQAEVTQFLARIPIGSEALYGFTDRSELDLIELGTPVAVLTVVPDSISDSTRINKDYLVPIHEWRVPVTVSGRMRAFLSVSKVRGIWKAVDFGAAGLAAELDQFMTDHATEASGRRLELLRLYQLHCDFAVLADVLPAGAPATIYPLRSATLMLERNGHAIERVYSREKLLPLLREGFRREATDEN